MLVFYTLTTFQKKNLLNKNNLEKSLQATKNFDLPLCVCVGGGGGGGGVCVGACVRTFMYVYVQSCDIIIRHFVMSPFKTVQFQI